MGFEIKGLRGTYEAWADQEPDFDRIMGVGLWMQRWLTESPVNVPGSQYVPWAQPRYLIRLDVFDVAIEWSVGARASAHPVAIVLRFADLLTGQEFSNI